MSNDNNEEQPRKYLRRAQDISTGVTTRSRKREGEMSPTTNSSPATASATPPASEKCPICFNEFTNQEVGMPENCEHNFCLSCILEWAKLNNSCPIDRIAFRQIRKKKSFQSAEPYATVKVKDNRHELELEENFLEMINDDVSCRVCGRDDQEDLLLICDECGNGYHTFCLGLPGVPEAPEWMCPLCEVDQLSAEEDLYPESDLEELHEVLADMAEDAADENRTSARSNRVRQTARMRTGTLRNQRATPATTTTTRTTNPRPPRRRTTRRTRQRSNGRRAAATRRLNPREQQRRRLRHERVARDQIHRRIEGVNAITRDEPANTRSVTIRNEAPRLSIYGDEPVAFDDEPETTTPSVANNRSIISATEAARQIAASGIPILSRSHTEPSISRELSLTRHAVNLDRVPSRTIRPAAATPARTRPRLPSPPRVPIHQLPRSQRRTNDTDDPTNGHSTSAILS